MPKVVQLARGQAALPIKNGLNPSRVRIPPEFHDRPAVDFLWHLISTQRRRHPDDDLSAAFQRFTADEVLESSGQQGRILDSDDTLTAGRDLWFYRTPAPETPVPFTCQVIYEDERLLVVDKPHFLATMPRGKHITQTATVQLRTLTGLDELSPAHRLDRLTSGVLVFTKQRAHRGAYQDLFAQRRVKKQYQAIATYDKTLTGAVWEHRMEKIPGYMQGQVVPGTSNARTELGQVTPLNQEEQALCEEIFGPQPPLASYALHPVTGRTHQLRLHMLLAGVPILGDPVYPLLVPEELEDFTVPMCLRCTSMDFIDPITSQPVQFAVPAILSVMHSSWETK